MRRHMQRTWRVRWRLALRFSPRVLLTRLSFCAPGLFAGVATNNFALDELVEVEAPKAKAKAKAKAE